MFMLMSVKDLSYVLRSTSRTGLVLLRSWTLTSRRKGSMAQNLVREMFDLVLEAVNLQFQSLFRSSVHLTKALSIRKCPTYLRFNLFSRNRLLITRLLRKSEENLK